MQCSNCGARIPRDHGACPECGVFARVVERKKGRGKRIALVVAAILVIAAGGALWLLRRTERPKPAAAPPIHVVGDRPGGARVGSGAAISEPEAILRLRRSLDLAPECVAVMSHGFHAGGYDLTAVDSCAGARLGRWRVDGKSGIISRR